MTKFEESVVGVLFAVFCLFCAFIFYADGKKSLISIPAIEAMSDVSSGIDDVIEKSSSIENVVDSVDNYLKLCDLDSKDISYKLREEKEGNSVKLLVEFQEGTIEDKKRTYYYIVSKSDDGLFVVKDGVLDT